MVEIDHPFSASENRWIGCRLLGLAIHEVNQELRQVWRITGKTLDCLVPRAFQLRRALLQSRGQQSAMDTFYPIAGIHLSKK
jgi:hypothetical protein